MSELNKLTDKYLRGETTNAEEQLLRRQALASESDDGADLAWLRALARYEEAQRPAPIVRLRPWRRVAAVAASVALVASVALTALHHRTPRSYAIIDGQRVTARQVVTDEALQALMMVSTDDEETFDALLQ